MTFKTVDGNTATAEIAYMLSEVSAIYPITPSSTMAELVSQWSSEGKQNIFGDTVLVREMQSEAGVSGAIHGALSCGALATTFTSSQGLLLMIPNMYKIAGECLPCVFHISARALATHALSIFCDHSDVMAVRSTGFNILASNSVQECYDMALASHLLTLKTSLPVLHFFDGFRTSHEIEKISIIDDADIKKIYPFKDLESFKNRALNTHNPIQKGTAQNPDVYFQNRERCNELYSKVFDKLTEVFSDIKSITGRSYSPYEYFGDSNAEYVIVAMGSGIETIKDTVKYLNNKGEKLGVLNVRLFRPFFSKRLVETLPKSVKKIAVLDRTKESGASGEPLYNDVCSAILENERNIKVIGGRYGIGGKEFNPSHVYAVYQNLMKEVPKNHFTVGICDDITNTSLPLSNFEILNDDCYNLKFYGLGSDGTVSANKNSIKIISQLENKYVQAYFEYDSKKSGSLTTSHLRLSNSPINKPYKALHHDFIAIHNFTFIGRYDLISSLKENGIVLLNTKLNDNKLGEYLPQEFVNVLKEKNATLYTIDAQKIANDVGLGGKINVIMQTAFFKLLKNIPFDQAIDKIKETTISTYSRKGDDIVNKNLKAIDLTIDSIKKIDYSNIVGYKSTRNSTTDCKFFDDVISKIEKNQGNELPVSSFSVDGSVPTNTSKYLKRGISASVPMWIKENCIQCGLCSLACPHGAIRSVLIVEKNDTKKNYDTIGMKGKKFRIQISPKDCTGCGVCVNTCPTLKKALKMQDDIDYFNKEEANYIYSQNLKKEKSIFNKFTSKGIQFYEPYFEYSYACAGCGEAPYIKLLTQLFGDNMIIANATGCSSIYGGSYPVCPYSKDKNGNGPSWANSLFEDNAEYGYGFKLAIEQEKKHNENNNKTATDKSVWIIGGDGWAYDIGYSGIDQILNSKENVNILVLDTELYSNTGGQSSKSTPLGSITKFNSNGKRTSKKDLGAIAMTSGNAYVASISLGANPNQAIKALKEAQEYNGPSLVICYCPCINHGFDMSKSNEHMKLCVESGYWNLYRFNPNNEKPLTMDSGAPTKDYKDFLLTETRYTNLIKKDPIHAEEIYNQSKIDAQKRYNNLLNILKNQE